MKFDGTIQELKKNKGAICNEILRSLPRWFGIEQAIANYVKAVEPLPTFGALIDEQQIAGFISLECHNPYTTEIHVMAVREEFHRCGVGQALVMFHCFRLNFLVESAGIESASA